MTVGAQHLTSLGQGRPCRGQWGSQAFRRWRDCLPAALECHGPRPPFCKFRLVRFRASSVLS